MSQTGMTRVTMKDVADRAGVSKTTVSHALNNTRQVEESTRLRIQQAVQDLGYVPNQTARSLKGKGSRNIGIIISDIRESFNAEVVKEIEEGALRKGYNVVICSSVDNREEELRALQLLIQKGMDAVIISPVDRSTSYTSCIPFGIPLIQFDRKTEADNCDFIGIDNYESSGRAVNLLLKNGCRRIGLAVYNESIYTMMERSRGYRDALAKAGREPLIFRAEDKESLLENMTEWISRNNPDALLCGNEHLSCTAFQAVTALNLHVPVDIRMISYDDGPWLSLLSSPLTVIRQPTGEMGRKILEITLNRIEKTEEKDIQSIILPSELVVRSSCGSL